jgi:hypothetical protein
VRSPPLGLALILAGLHAISAPLRMLANMLALPSGWIGEVGAVTLLQVAVAVLQIGTGVASVRRSSAARPLLIAYGAATVALAIVAVIVIGRDLGVAPRIGFVVEIVGAPVVIGIVAALVPLSPTRVRLDAGAVLVGVGLAAWLATPVQIASTLRWMRQARDVSAGTVAGQLIFPVVALVIGALALRAGTRLVRGPADIGRRATFVYVVVAIALALVLTAVAIIVTLVDSPRYAPFLLTSQSISLVLSIATPLAIWWYVRGTVDDGVTGESSATLAWIALLFVPTLLARLTFVGELGGMPRIILVLAVGGGGCLAVILLRTALALLRGGEARVAALTGAVVATTLFVLVAIALLVESSPATQPIYQLALVVATAATMAWLARISSADRKLRALP